MKRRDFVASLGVGVAAAAARVRSGQGPARRPNILFIMTDDHASHAMGCYGSRINATPNMDRIAREGVRFDDCFCTNGLCAPSRAVIFTGQHSHRNGVRDNAHPFDGSQVTFPKLLRAAGYQTALLGKWHLQSDPTGFDYWNILPGQGDYYNPDLIEMGATRRYPGYVTDILTELALDYVKSRRRKDAPFLLMLHHKAPHRNWQPALRNLKAFDSAALPLPETFYDDYATRSRAAREQEMTVKTHLEIASDLKMGPAPARMTAEQKAVWEEAYAPKRAAFERDKPLGDDLLRWKYRRYMEDYLGCVAGVDESVGALLSCLDAEGLARDTLVVYTSDQGFFLGDHGWFDKRFMYEESLRMPLVMRWPGVIRPGAVAADLVSNLDFGPTFLALAGLVPPAVMQGVPFDDILRTGTTSRPRTSVYYHYYEYPSDHMVKRHYGVRTKRYKLIHFYYDIDAWELYDLERDPHELRNLAGDPAYAAVLRDLTAELRRKQAEAGDSDELARAFLAQDLKELKKL